MRHSEWQIPWTSEVLAKKKIPNIDSFPTCCKSLLSITCHNLCDCTETYRSDELLYNLAKHVFLHSKCYKFDGTRIQVSRALLYLLQEKLLNIDYLNRRSEFEVMFQHKEYYSDYLSVIHIHSTCVWSYLHHKSVKVLRFQLWVYIILANEFSTKSDNRVPPHTP